MKSELQDLLAYWVRRGHADTETHARYLAKSLLKCLADELRATGSTLDALTLYDLGLEL